MKINYNASAMITNKILNSNNSKLSESMEKLSSGYKINSVKDNPSGMAIGRRMKAQLRGLEAANDNSNDGISVLETIDGALVEVHDMLQRMNELAIKSANGTNSDEDRKVINDEVEQLKTEIQRISDTTQFNGQHLLDGTFDLKAYTDNVNVKVFSYSEVVPKGIYEIEIVKNGADIEFNGITNAPFGWNGQAGIKHEIIDNELIISGDNGFDIKMDVNVDGLVAGTNTIQLDMKGIGDMTLQIGANEGQTIGIVVSNTSIKHIGIAKSNVKTVDSAKEAIDQVAKGIQYISTVRGRIGAYQNRVEHTISSLEVSEENMTRSYSRIMDTNMAEEMTEYTSMQVLMQAGTSMLAQANERPSSILQLLQ